MRVVAGFLGGRTFDAPRGHRTHPMSDKVRGALFNMLGDIDGLTVLDAFSGSGALSIEAISRGAASAVAIDVDKTAAQTIAQNAHNLGIAPRLKVVRANASGWSVHNADARFAIVLLDPPYDDVQLSVVQTMAAHVADDGIVVLSWPGAATPPPLPQMQMLVQKSYGDIQLIVFRRQSATL